MSFDNDGRLVAMRAVDAVIAALQATFALPDLVNGDNPFRYNPDDKVNSALWIADSESRLLTERGGARSMILVDRSDYIPQNLHQNNYGGSRGADESFYSDLGVTQVYMHCEAGGRYQSEQLAGLCYQILKAFRSDLMREFDLHSLRPLSVGVAQKIDGATGSPWRTTATVQVMTQEKLLVTDIANRLNHVDFVQRYEKNAQSRRLLRLDVGATGTDFSTADSTPPNP